MNRKQEKQRVKVTDKYRADSNRWLTRPAAAVTNSLLDNTENKKNRETDTQRDRDGALTQHFTFILSLLPLVTNFTSPAIFIYGFRHNACLSCWLRSRQMIRRCWSVPRFDIAAWYLSGWSAFWHCQSLENCSHPTVIVVGAHKEVLDHRWGCASRLPGPVNLWRCMSLQL